MKKSFTLLLIFALCLTVSVLASGFVTTALTGSIDPAAVTLVSYSTMMGLTILLMRLFAPRYGWVMANASPRLGRVNLSLVLMSLLTIEALGIVIEPLLSMIPDVYLDGMYQSMDGGMWSIVTFTLAAPILEEFLFRGILQQNFVRYLGVYGGILLAAVVFGVIHLVPQQVAVAVLAGVVIGAVYYITHSLFTAILIHLLNNGLAYFTWLCFGNGVSYRELFGLSGESYTYFYYGAVGFVVVVTVIGIYLIERKRK